MKFAEYLQIEREDGQDINNWSFESLKAAAVNFKRNEEREKENAEMVEEKNLRKGPHMSDDDLEMTICQTQETEPIMKLTEKKRDPEIQAKLNDLLAQANEAKSSVVVYDIYGEL